jgi:hypothetical protein
VVKTIISHVVGVSSVPGGNFFRTDVLTWGFEFENQSDLTTGSTAPQGPEGVVTYIFDIMLNLEWAM